MICIYDTSIPLYSILLVILLPATTCLIITSTRAHSYTQSTYNESTLIPFKYTTSNDSLDCQHSPLSTPTRGNGPSSTASESITPLNTFNCLFASASLVLVSSISRLILLLSFTSLSSLATWWCLMVSTLSCMYLTLSTTSIILSYDMLSSRRHTSHALSMYVIYSIYIAY